jgi:hypothetical protein
MTPSEEIIAKKRRDRFKSVRPNTMMGLDLKQGTPDKALEEISERTNTEEVLQPEFKNYPQAGKLTSR